MHPLPIAKEFSSQPKRKNANNAQHDRDEHGIVPPHAISNKTGEVATETRAGVEDGDELVGEGGGEVGGEGVGR